MGAAPSWDARLSRDPAHWREVLGRVAITRAAGQAGLRRHRRDDAFAHILTSRDGPMLKPGTRSYDRAWIRDGAMMSEALLRMGRADVARGFADWYAAICSTAARCRAASISAAPTRCPENDSQGEYIFLVHQLYRFTGDRAALERDWPAVLGATRYMDKLAPDPSGPRRTARRASACCTG